MARLKAALLREHEDNEVCCQGQGVGRGPALSQTPPPTPPPSLSPSPSPPLSLSHSPSPPPLSPGPSNGHLQPSQHPGSGALLQVRYLAPHTVSGAPASPRPLPSSPRPLPSSPHPLPSSRGEKMAKVMGRLAGEPPQDGLRVSGVLIKRGFNYHLIEPSDLSSESYLVPGSCDLYMCVLHVIIM